MAVTPGWLSGTGVRMAVGGKVILGAKDCSVNLKPKYAQIKNKDTAGSNEQIAVGVDWTMNCNAHTTFTTDTNKTTHTVLFAAALAQTKLTLTFSMMTTAASPVPNAGDQLYTGFAYIDDASLKATLDNPVDSTYNFIGSGSLVQSVAV
jgi:hypothetical protein